MNQLCKVCGEPAAGFHFGAFTCEGCKSFFGRTYNNISAIAGCKNNGDCVINKKNRTACKACRLRKCLLVGMSKGGSRYGRRSNWFKIHCLLQEQQTTTGNGPGGGGVGSGGGPGGVNGENNLSRANFEQLARLHQLQVRQTYQDKTNPSIKATSMSPTQLALSAAAAAAAVAANSRRSSPHQSSNQHSLLNSAAKFLNGVAAADGMTRHQQHGEHHQSQYNHQHHHQHQHQNYPHHIHPHQQLPTFAYGKAETRLSETPSDSGASSAGDAADDAHSSLSGRQERNCNSAQHIVSTTYDDLDANELRERRHRQLLEIYRSQSEPLRNHFPHFALPPPHMSPLAAPPITLFSTTQTARKPPDHLMPTAALKDEMQRVSEVTVAASAAATAAVAASASASGATTASTLQEEPIDLSLKGAQDTESSANKKRAEATDDDNSRASTPTTSPHPSNSPQKLTVDIPTSLPHAVIHKPTPLDLTLVRSQTLTG